MNNFSEVKQFRESEKYYLVKVNAKRIIDNIDYTWTLVDNLEWEVTGPGLENLDIEDFNGYEEKATANEVGGGDHWHFDRTTKVLTVSTGFGDLPSQRNIVTHALFFSSGVLKFASKNPLDLDTRKVHWENRIETLPSFGTSIENNLFGLISTTLSNIEFNNRDKFFNEYFSNKDIIAKNDVTVWRGINEEENVQIVFVGRITKAVLGDIVNLEVEDLLTNLDETFYSRANSEGVSTYKIYGGINEDDRDKPIPRLYGLCTPFALQLKDSDQNTYQIDTENQVWPQATNINVQSASTSNNREWSCCMTDFPLFNQIDTIAGASLRTISGKNDLLITLGTPSPNLEMLRVGSGVRINASSNKYFTVTDILPDTNQIVLDPYDASVSASMAMDWSMIDVVFIKQSGSTYRLMPYRDYNSISGITLDRNIQLVNNFESNVGMGTLQPDAEVYYRIVLPRTNLSKHANILKRALSGFDVDNDLPTNDTQFDNIDTQFPIDLSFLYAKDGFETRRQFIAKVLNSTYGYIHFDENYELNYRIFTEENVAGEFSEKDFFRNSMKTEVNYEDTFREMNARNLSFPENERFPEQNIFIFGGEHGGDTKEFEHVLDTSLSFYNDNTLARIINIFRIISQPRYITSATLGSSSFEAVIGQDYLIQTKELRGTDSQEVLKIISLTKTPSENSVLLSNIQRGEARVYYFAPGLGTITVGNNEYTDF